MVYWPSPSAQIVIYRSAVKRVDETDIWEIISFHHLELERLRYGHRDDRDLLYRSRSSLARAVLSGGRTLEVGIRLDARVEYERCIVFHARLVR